jgi:hypothetical protein
VPALSSDVNSVAKVWTPASAVGVAAAEGVSAAGADVAACVGEGGAAVPVACEFGCASAVGLTATKASTTILSKMTSGKTIGIFFIGSPMGLDNRDCVMSVGIVLWHAEPFPGTRMNLPGGAHGYYRGIWRIANKGHV